MRTSLEDAMLNQYRRSRGAWLKSCSQAFTLIELLVIIGTVATLSLLLLPALAGAKADTWRVQCQSNLKQLGTGFHLFEQDHGGMFTAAGFNNMAGQLAWDTYLQRYIGGTAPDSWITTGVVPIEMSPKIEYCPTDAPGRNPKVAWVGNPPWNGLRSYAMVGVGPSYSSDYQVDPRNRTYPLPTIKEGVGIYWAENSGLSSPDWDAKSYRTTVVRDPAGTILLVEAPNGQDAAGNIWPCICVGPVWSPSGSAPSAFYQLDPTRPIQNPGSGSAVSQGWITYQAHGNRFNYLFHDNHVEALTIEQTIGTGTTNAPKGMWTVAVGD